MNEEENNNKIVKEIKININKKPKSDIDFLRFICNETNYFPEGDYDNFESKLCFGLMNIHELNKEIIIGKLNKLLSNCINEKKIEFINNDKIATLFCYIHLMNNNVFSQSGDLIYFNNRTTAKPAPFHFLSISKLKLVNSIKTMRLDFINFINYMDCHFNYKHKYLDYLNESYAYQRRHFPFHWIDARDKEQLIWAKSYLYKSDLVNRNFKKIPELFHDERYIHIFIPSLFYAIPLSYSDKALFLINMKKAWGQVKYRNKIKRDKKTTLNLVVDELIAEKLKYLSTEFDQPVNQVVSMMTLQWANKAQEIKQQLEEKSRKDKARFNALFE